MEKNVKKFGFERQLAVLAVALCQPECEAAVGRT